MNVYRVVDASYATNPLFLIWEIRKIIETSLTSFTAAGLR